MSVDCECRFYERIASDGGGGGWARPGGAALTDRAVALCDFRPGSCLLDVGCGTGATAEHLTRRFGFCVAGVDPSLTMIRMRRAAEGAPFLLRAAGEALPFGDVVWDGVLLECSLSLSRDPRRVLQEARRVLREDGKLILQDVYVRNEDAVGELRSLSLDSCVVGARTRAELSDDLSECGFSLGTWEDHSTELKVFLGQLILSGTTAGSFWCSLMGRQPGGDVGNLRQVLKRSRIGYFLAVANKISKSNGESCG